MKKMEKDDNRQYVKFSIGAKLVVIISVLTILSLGIITLLVTWFGGQDVRISAEENNRTVNAQAANLAEKDLSSLRANAFLLLDILNRTGSGSSFAKEASDFYFERNPSVAAVLVTDSRRAGGLERFSRIRHPDARAVLAIRGKRFASRFGGFLFCRKTVRQLRCGYATDDVFGKRRGRYPDPSRFQFGKKRRECRQFFAFYANAGKRRHKSPASRHR